jgi:hypothetical protein
MTNRDARSTYLKLAEARLVEIQAKATIIDLKSKNEIAAGQSCVIDQITRSNTQVEQFMATARQKLNDLNSADDANWEAARDAFNSAWEDVSQAIRKAVSRFT